MPGSEKMVMLMKQLQDMVKNQYPTVSIDMMTTCILTELYGQISLTPPLDPENLFHKLSCKTDVPAQKFFFSIWRFDAGNGGKGYDISGWTDGDYLEVSGGVCNWASRKLWKKLIDWRRLRV